MSGKVKWTRFETPIGSCAVAWDDNGLVGVQLPEASVAATEARMRRRWPGSEASAPSSEVSQAIARIVTLLQSGRADFSDIKLNLEQVPEFNRRVYQITAAIPAGQVMTYGAIARQLGDPALAREVGQAMGQNPIPLVIPCHRVVAAGGKPGGFSGGIGTETKLQLLRIEGADLGGQPSLFDNSSPGR